MQILIVCDSFEDDSQSLVSDLVLYQSNESELFARLPYKIEYLFEVVVFY